LPHCPALNGLKAQSSPSASTVKETKIYSSTKLGNMAKELNKRASIASMHGESLQWEKGASGYVGNAGSANAEGNPAQNSVETADSTATPLAGKVAETVLDEQKPPAPPKTAPVITPVICMNEVGSDDEMYEVVDDEHGARFSPENFHSRMPLDPTPARLKL
jgi:hypothetical protein